MKRRKINAIIICSSCLLLFAVLAFLVLQACNSPWQDDKRAYNSQDESSVATMYLSVYKGSEAMDTNHTWEEINTYSTSYYEEQGMKRYKAEVLLQVGDENGPRPGELGYGYTSPNATVKIRGQSTSSAEQKSYKIELQQDAGLWEGQQIINLNKHQGDGLRFRNKIMYHVMSEVPQIASLRTQFVHLYVKDMASGKTEFEDYGLYTHVEELDNLGMLAHGMDSGGNLYKANVLFDFGRFEDDIKTEDDPAFDEKAFEYHLEIKGNRDHSKLIEMLDALNDESIPIEKILDKYFDIENLAYWMGFMILTGNVDTNGHNYYLYSPRSSEKWYMIPWDNDAAFTYREAAGLDDGYWRKGVKTYWSSELFRRCLLAPSFRQALDDAVGDLLANYLTEEKLLDDVNAYSAVVKPYLYQEGTPDSKYVRMKPEEYDMDAGAIPTRIQVNHERYLDSLKSPMPFFSGTPRQSEEGLYVRWGESCSLSGQEITYNVEISDDPSFQTALVKREGLKDIRLTLPVWLDQGEYFLKIRAVSESGVQGNFESYTAPDNIHYYGVRKFTVLEDGTIQ